MRDAVSLGDCLEGVGCNTPICLRSEHEIAVINCLSGRLPQQIGGFQMVFSRSASVSEFS